jgi:hypothetical protein
VTGELVVVHEHEELTRLGPRANAPPVVQEAGHRAEEVFVACFAAGVRHANTRVACRRARPFPFVPPPETFGHDSDGHTPPGLPRRCIGVVGVSGRTTGCGGGGPGTLANAWHTGQRISVPAHTADTRKSC